MDSKNKNGPKPTLYDRLSSMSAAEVVKLGIQLCQAAAQAVGDGYHGGVWPGNITFNADGSAVLGKASPDSAMEMGPDRLEYIAPEVFWRKERAPTADVYSIGMVLYTAFFGGGRPFIPKGEHATSENRAEAMRRRMKGEEIPALEYCEDKLNAAIMTALSFEVEDRFRTPKAFMTALEACGDFGEAGASAAVPGAAAAGTDNSEEDVHGTEDVADDQALDDQAHSFDEENVEDSAQNDTGEPDEDAAPAEPENIQATPSFAAENARPRYMVDKDFEAKEPGKRPVAWMMVIIGVAVAVVIILLTLKSCQGEDPDLLGTSPATNSPADATPTESPADVTPTENPADVTPTENPADVTPTESPADVTPTENPANVTPSSTPGNGGGTNQGGTNPGQDNKPAEGTTAGKTMISGNYTLVVANCTWAEARLKCEELGGHLAVIRNETELNSIISMAEEMGVSYVWLGAQRDASGNMKWVTGESIDYYPWDINEPSYKDAYDGTAEDYLMLWNVSFGKHSGWAYNDSRSDPAGDYPGVYSGKIAYICEFDS